eukprot:GFYU01023889.1.p1 GENE.GFYU01023889.1~~GFYU01023889.1.p1  ORF type:complete len:570 (-),score=105.17 GFYU01023889.1:72-1781(-)
MVSNMWSRIRDQRRITFPLAALLVSILGVATITVSHVDVHGRPHEYHIESGMTFSGMKKALNETIEAAAKDGFPTGEGVELQRTFDHVLDSFLDLGSATAQNEDTTKFRKALQVMSFFNMLKAWSDISEWTFLMNMQYPKYHPIPAFKEADDFIHTQLPVFAPKQRNALITVLNLENVLSDVTKQCQNVPTSQKDNGFRSIAKLTVAVIDQFDDDLVAKQLPGTTVTRLDGPSSDHGNGVLDVMLSLVPKDCVKFKLFTAMKNITTALDMMADDATVDLVNESEGWQFLTKGIDADKYEAALKKMMQRKMYFKPMGNEGVDYTTHPPYYNRTRTSGSIGSDDADNIPYLVSDWTQQDQHMYHIVFGINFRSDLSELSAHASAPGTLPPLQALGMAAPGTFYFALTDAVESGSSYVAPLLGAVCTVLLTHLSQQTRAIAHRWMTEGGGEHLGNCPWSDASASTSDECGCLHGVRAPGVGGDSGSDGGNPNDSIPVSAATASLTPSVKYGCLMTSVQAHQLVREALLATAITAPLNEPTHTFPAAEVGQGFVNADAARQYLDKKVTEMTSV